MFQHSSKIIMDIYLSVDSVKSTLQIQYCLLEKANLNYCRHFSALKMVEVLRKT